MNGMLEYNGYMGTVEYSKEDQCLHGQIAYIRSLITYEATSVIDLEKEFKKAVDEYLQDCRDLGIEPNKPFKGSFNVRTGEELHRLAVIASGKQSLNAFVCDAIREKVGRLHQ